MIKAIVVVWLLGLLYYCISRFVYEWWRVNNELDAYLGNIPLWLCFMGIGLPVYLIVAIVLTVILVVFS